MEIDLTEPQRYTATSLKPLNLFMAGTGSGKSHLGGLLSMNYSINFPKVRGLIGANTYMQLTQSTMFRIREVWKKQFNLIENRDYVIDKRPPSHFKTEGHNFDDYYSIISFRWGTVIFKASLDRAKTHEGKEIGWAICDETKDSREEDIKDVIIARLRQPGIFVKGNHLVKEETDTSFNPLHILTTPAKVDWINEWFELDSFEDEIVTKIYDKNDFFAKEYSNKCVTISSLYHNLKNLSTGYVDNLLITHTDRDGKLKQSGKRLIFGDPFSKVGGEFYSSFDRARHIQPTPLLPGSPIHISYDFNVVPYMTLVCFQVVTKGENYIIRAFDEFCLESPNNSTERVTLAFKRKYEKILEYGLYYYGDPSGSRRDTRARKNDFWYIEEALAEYLNNYSKRVPVKAPPVIPRRDFINNLFDEKYPIRIQIDPKCRKLIADLEYVKEDPEGKKLKVPVKDIDTGQTYEKYGHCMAKGTKIITSKGEINIEDVKKGDYVLTRAGFKKVLWSGITGKNKKVNTYKIGNTTLRCTPDHKIFTTVGFKRSELLIGQHILCIFERKKCEKQELSMDTNLTDIRKQKINLIEDISEDGLKERKNIFTGMFGNFIMDIFQKAFTYIIKMVILLITKLKTWNYGKDQNIYHTIMINFHRNLRMKKRSNYLKKLNPKQWNGIVLKKEGNGIVNTLINHFLTILKKKNVKSAEKSFLTSVRKPNFVPENVKADIGCVLIDRQVSMMKNENASFVVKNSVYINGQKPYLVVENVQIISEIIEPEVYDLHIEDQHEYFANGILVHNCSDALDYFATEAFKKYFKK